MAESMNVSKTRLCGKILKKLMDNKGGWLFHKPVDPVLYGIPDYFDVICNPMDLGTVKKKLTNKQYVTTSEFAADEDDRISRIQSNENSILSNEIESPSCNSTSPLASSEQGVESYLHNEPLSPSKALRIAMLKSRFAGTIVKAQQNALLDHGKEVDLAKLQLEKERLEKRQQEERARIEAQVKAAEAAAQLKLEEEMRTKREKERNAARLALHMMKKTVDIDNSDFLKDLENLCQKWQLNPPSKLIVDFVHGFELPQGLGSPLEALGLFMKQDLEEEVEHEMEESMSTSLNADVEEGEINCCQ
nr:unnamed protein product [Digitaria exilis]